MIELPHTSGNSSIKVVPALARVYAVLIESDFLLGYNSVPFSNGTTHGVSFPLIKKEPHAAVRSLRWKYSLTPCQLIYTDMSPNLFWWLNLTFPYPNQEKTSCRSILKFYLMELYHSVKLSSLYWICRLTVSYSGGNWTWTEIRDKSSRPSPNQLQVIQPTLCVCKLYLRFLNIRYLGTTGNTAFIFFLLLEFQLGVRQGFSLIVTTILFGSQVRLSLLPLHN